MSKQVCGDGQAQPGVPAEFNIACRSCMEILPDNQSPASWMRFEVAISSVGRITINCVRHGMLVATFPLDASVIPSLKGRGCEAPGCPGHGEGSTL